MADVFIFLVLGILALAVVFAGLGHIYLNYWLAAVQRRLDDEQK